MHGIRRTVGLKIGLKVVLACGLALVVVLMQVNALAYGDEVGAVVVGRTLDAQEEPVHGAKIELLDGEGAVLGEGESQEDGTFVVELEDLSQTLAVEVSRPHFDMVSYEVEGDEIEKLAQGETLRLPDITLERRITAGFWFAIATFALVLLLIALERLHSTTAALMGVVMVLVASFILTPIWPGLFIYDFERALTFIDFEVVFLVMGMMIVIGIIEGTGIFQWLTYVAFRASRGRVEVLVVILMLITSVASALLDNVTTMLLMAPITLQIALALGINPFSLLLPEVMASNVGGISTLVGTPTNILIGSFANIGFNDFIVNLTPGAVLASIALVIYVLLRYRKEYQSAGSNVSSALVEKLETDAQIRDKRTLIKALIVFAGIIVLFVIGESIELSAAAAALMGATVMLLWVNPDVDHMLRAVDWTTLVFFMAMFMLVGAVREVGLMSILAGSISQLIGDKLVIGLIILVSFVGLLSSVVANIPLTAAMLPVVRALTRAIPGAESNVLYYGLSVGAAMGGNATLIGGETNIITAGIAERAGFRLSFFDFFKVGFPATLITIAVGIIWLLVRF